MIREAIALIFIFFQIVVADNDCVGGDEGDCGSDQEAMVSLLMVSSANSRSTVEIREDSSTYSSAFDDFVKAHGRLYTPHGEEYQMRKTIFEQRTATVEAQNARPGATWKAAINALADWTDAELQSLRGYKRTGAHRPAARDGASLALSEADVMRGVDMWSLPEEFSWQGRLAATREVQDQGTCGSCWAFSAATTLRAHSELFQKDAQFSTQHLVSCVPNPSECGGSGGCGGATVELAYDYVMQRGLSIESSWPYAASNTECPDMHMLSMPSVLPQPVNSTAAAILNAEGENDSVALTSDTTISASAMGMLGWMKLPENRIQPVLEALYTRGPVAISIAAGFDWNIYSSGVLSACEPDAIVNHAVMLVGYGVDNHLGYWHVQNSWGATWGENGFIRLARKLNFTAEQEYCGVDDQPLVGSGCIGGPSAVTVCGTCGILSDAVVPKLALGRDGWWAQHPSR